MDLFPTFLNFAFSKGGYEFGTFGETLSSCFGKKRLEKSLSITGQIVRLIIDFFDYTKWKNGGHCVANIMKNREIKEVRETFMTKL